MAKLGALRNDTKRENEGVWVDYESGIRFLVARMGNPAYSKRLEELGKPHLRAARSGSLTNEVALKITKRAMAETILLAWEGVEDDKGKAMAYTPELGLEIFNDEAYRDIYEFVRDEASERENYRLDFEADSVGN